MAGQNRHLSGDLNEISVPIHSDCVVEPGDFMVVGNATAMDQSGRGKDYYGYSFANVSNSLTNAGPRIVIAGFLGVAMGGSKAGVTENITVATEGVFRYPYYSLGTLTTGTTIGLYVSCVTPATTSHGVSPQHVSLKAVGKTLHGTTGYLGYCVRDNPGGTTYVDFNIHTIYGLGLIT